MVLPHTLPALPAFPVPLLGVRHLLQLPFLPCSILLYYDTIPTDL